MNTEEYKIKFRNSEGIEITSRHDNQEIFREHRRKISEQGGTILEVSGPFEQVNEGKVQILSE